MDIQVLSIVAILYLGVVGYLGFRGYKATTTTSDYLVAGRKAHPFVMALSYGATFISTSAIVGFGGAAAAFGMGLLWLTFLNIFVGIFIAFTLFGGRTRKMGHHLQAHTFPELLGKRFNSRFIQAFSGLIVVVFMPLYAAAVLIGAAQYIKTAFDVNYGVAVTIFSLIIAAYVVAGGLKSVMYTDALQGTLMFIGMILLLVLTYGKLGGVTTAHKKLDELPKRIEEQYQAALPDIKAGAPPGTPDADVFRWLGGGAGALKATAGMSDGEQAAYYAANPGVTAEQAMAVGDVLEAHPELANRLVVASLRKGGFQGWTRFPTSGSKFWYVLVTSIIAGVGIGVLAQPQLAVRFMTVKSQRELNRAILVGGVFILVMTGVAFTCGALSNVWFWLPENGGKVSLAKVPGGNLDLIIPAFVSAALPSWFGAIFMLTLLSAAMSTLSSQFHAMGTSIGRDVFERGILGAQEHPQTVLITRAGIILTIMATVILAFELPDGIIAAATAIFFGLCAAAFLPMYVGGLFWQGMTKAGAVASLCTGFGVSFFWLMFVQQAKGKLSAMLAARLLGVPTLLPEPVFGIQWNWVEALFVALPISAIVAVVVSLLTKPEPPEHIRKCFEGIGG